MAPGTESEYRDTLRIGNFVAADVILPAGVWTELGHFDIPNATELLLGFGQTSGQANAQGRIYANIVEAGPAAIAGKIRFELRNPNNRPKITLAEFNAESLITSATDRAQQMPLPEVSEIMSERWILVVLFLADALKTVDVSISTLNVDCTVRDMAAR